MLKYLGDRTIAIALVLLLVVVLTTRAVSVHMTVNDLVFAIVVAIMIDLNELWRQHRVNRASAVLGRLLREGLVVSVYVSRTNARKSSVGWGAPWNTPPWSLRRVIRPYSPGQLREAMRQLAKEDPIFELLEGGPPGSWKITKLRLRGSD